MEIVLDTNAVSDLLKNRPEILKVLQPYSKLLLPSVVAGEYLFGIRGSTKERELSRVFFELVSICEVLPIDYKAAEQYAVVRAHLKASGNPIPSNDLWIAAATLARKGPLLTRDGHFSKVPGVRVVNW